jgi:hypothetical protein
MPHQLVVDCLPALARQAVLDLAETLRAILGPDLLSLTVYGPAAGASFQPRRDRIHTALVLRTVEMDKLHQLAQRGREFLAAGVAAPLILTPEFLAGSLDTFPLELLEIQQRHATVLGDDAFASLVLDPERMARQCERELKVLAIGMHQRLLASGGRDRDLRAMSNETAEHLCRTLRGLLWLKREREPVPMQQLAAAAQKAFGRELPGLAAALQFAQQESWSLFRALYDDVAALGKLADGL